MICEIKHYAGEDKPWGLFVNNEFVGEFDSIQEAAAFYEQMLKKEKKGE